MIYNIGTNNSKGDDNMFFFLQKGMFPVAYTSMTTKTSKKAIKEIGFQNWIQNTATYKTLISALPQIQNSDETTDNPYSHFFNTIKLESDGLSIKQIDDSANVYCDVMSSHNKKRIRLDMIIDAYFIGCVYVTDIHVLGDTVEEIVDVYERCLKNEKVICVIDNSKDSRVSEYSMCDIAGNPYPINQQREIIDKLATLASNNASKKEVLGNSRGTNKLMLTQDFWNAYFLYEITMEIPEDIAVTLSGMSKNSFITKCLDIECSYDQLMLRVGTKFYSYEEILQKTFELKGMTAEQFYTVPKRLGAIPSSDKMTFSELRAIMTEKESETKDLASLQSQLDFICMENDLPKMLYLTYKRYCVKQDNPSKKTFSKFFNYDSSKVDAYHNFVDSIKKASELMGKADYTDMCREVLRPMYAFDIPQ